MRASIRRLLERLYKDIHSPVAFTSVVPLLTEAKKHQKEVTRHDVEEYLAGERVYTLHRRAVRRYRHMPTLASGLHTEWQADLASFDRLSRDNNGYKYLLVCIDTLSRQLFVEPVKTKSAGEMIGAFERLFKRSVYIPWKLVTDQGREFTAKDVQDFFRSKQIKHFCMFTSPKFHAGMAERANRSIKERLYRYFTERQTQRWVDRIQDIVNAINKSFNSSIGMRPVDVTFKNAENLRAKLNQSAATRNPKRAAARFSVGDQVRIEKHKHTFQKGYLPNFTSEIFTVDKVRKLSTTPITYRIRDSAGELIKGWFYAYDLCRVLQPGREEKGGVNGSDKLYDIDHIIKKRKKGGIEYLFVKWRGFGKQHNSWIPASTLTWK